MASMLERGYERDRKSSQSKLRWGGGNPSGLNERGLRGSGRGP